MFDKDTLKTIGLIVIALFIYKQFFSDSGKGIKEKFQTTTTIPKGVIVAWNGSVETIPSGWALCDGKSGTPNLSGRFILGVNSTQYTDTNKEVITARTVGKTGGKEQHILAQDEMPFHKHETAPKKLNNTCECGGGSCACGYEGENKSYKSDWDNVLSMVGMGNNKPHENMPPFYVLAYIMKL
jgi:microcystin-dependent protein